MEQPYFFPLCGIPERQMFLSENTCIPSFTHPVRVVLKKVWLCSHQEQERLSTAMTDMQTFWNVLERKRRQLEWEGERSTGPAGHETLPESMGLIQLELRDLMSQVSSQVATTFTETILTRFCFRGSDARGGLTEQFLFCSPAETGSELLDGAASPSGGSAAASPRQLREGLGQPCGGLHYSEGSRPVPRQAGKRLPAAGVAKRHKSAMRKKKGSLENASERRQNSRIRQGKNKNR